MLTEAERNYEIYDKELLAIVEALKEWRQYLEKRKTFNIISNHSNLQYWKSPQDLTRQQARWASWLSQFNFKIVYKPGKTLMQAGTLLRRKDWKRKDKEDNKEVIVLKEEVFRKEEKGGLLVEKEEKEDIWIEDKINKEIGGMKEENNKNKKKEQMLVENKEEEIEKAKEVVK